MWPSKKDNSIKIPPGGSIEIGFAVAWRSDKDEVIIKTDDGEIILDGKNELFLEVTANNTEGVKVQIIPDFKNRTLNVVEVIEVNDKKVNDKNKGKITFAGVSTSKDDTISVDKHIKIYDENIEKLGKQIKNQWRSTKIIVIMNMVLIIISLDMFINENWPLRYINLISIVLSGFVVYYLWNEHRKARKIYEKYKNMRSESFELVKNI
jgi:hypothetical protein